MTHVTNQDVCEFFGFSKGLDLGLPGSMVMILDKAAALTGGYISLAYGLHSWSHSNSKPEWLCIIDGYSGCGATSPKAVLEAVKEFIRRERG